MFAGTIADADLLSVLFGPGPYLSTRHTFTHAIAGTAVVILVTVGIAFILRPKSSPSRRPTRDAENAPQKADPRKDPGIATLLIAVTLAAVLHVLMDLCTSAGLALLWPWRETRFAWDWLPGVDLWILVLLLAGVLLPELFGLVGAEIGTKDQAPRGRTGAIAALVLALIYAGARATLHGNAVAQLDAHTYRGESPRRLAAFADPFSLMNWHGVVETAGQICTVNVPASESVPFDPDSGVCVHKPEDSPLLQAAEHTVAMQKFMQAARFPKASVGATEDGTEVVVRDLRDGTENEIRFAVVVRILLDRNRQVTSQRTLWAAKVLLK